MTFVRRRWTSFGYLMTKLLLTRLSPATGIVEPFQDILPGGVAVPKQHPHVFVSADQGDLRNS